MAYANWRGGNTLAERKAYNSTDQILLTFDDYANPAIIDQFLDILSKNNVKAAFFVLGSWARDNRETIEKLKASGHFVGNHSTNHPRLRKLSDDQIQQEIMNGEPSTLLRPPYGDCDARVRGIALKLGYKLALWTIDSEDWRDIPVQSIIDRVIRELHPGACILLHLNGKQTLTALPVLIGAIRSSGSTLWNGGNLG